MTDTELILRCTQVVELNDRLASIARILEAFERASACGLNIPRDEFQAQHDSALRERSELLDCIRSECNWGQAEPA